MSTQTDQRTRARVAVVDDEAITAREIKRHFSEAPCHVDVFADGETFIQKNRTEPFDVILCDLRLPGINGLDVLNQVKQANPNCEVIIMTGYGAVETAIAAIKKGAFHYITKPFKTAELKSLVFRALEKVALVKEKESLKKALFPDQPFIDLVGSSKAISEVKKLIRKVAPLNCNILIQGESGTGKEIVARILHEQSPRNNGPFVSFNCGGFTEDLIANELFGHEKGAFTGAVDTRIGLIESSHEGTIFLDEIGEMPATMQVKLLRFVQERKLNRVGGIRPVTVDTRLIAATNQDLKELVAVKKFREDLYYRLNVVLITLPPLRMRKEDIPLLIRHFLSRYNMGFCKAIKGVDNEALRIFTHYPFPGNVRELQNIIERTVALCDDHIIHPKDLPPDLQRLDIDSVEEDQPLSLEEKEKEHIQQVLRQTNFQRARTAEILKIPRTTLWRKMKRYKLV
jgi:two-component system, NtrC family, response regulator AtoC